MCYNVLVVRAYVCENNMNTADSDCGLSPDGDCAFPFSVLTGKYFKMRCINYDAQRRKNSHY